MNVFYKEQMRPYIDRFLAETEKKVYAEAAPLTLTARVTSEPVPFAERLNGAYRPVSVGEKWGELWDCAWFHVTGTVPETCKGKKTVLRLDLSGEACVYGKDGTPLQGLTSVRDSFDPLFGSPAKTIFVLSECAEGGEEVDFYLDAGCNDLFGRFQTGTVRTAHIAVCRESLRRFYFDYRFLASLLGQLDKDGARYASVLYALYDAYTLVSDYTDEQIAQADTLLRAQIDRKGGDPSLTVSALGHSHLDLAWLWPIRETKRKAVRTFSTALKNLETYPEYVFCASQPQQYAWVEEQSPALFEKIRRAVGEGRFEPVGAMWVEPDLNVTGGESLVRQVLYGTRYYREKFGKRVSNAWLPDVFGFNAALPQILYRSGVTDLLTIKLSWNKYTRFPHHSFVWRGIDNDSSVLVHMPPEGTYNSSASPESVKAAEKKYVEKGLSRHAMMLYGIGDGGGGPDASHIENLRRERNTDGLAPVIPETAESFFGKLRSEIGRLPVYRGEMYLEKHQGTYTTQAKNKYYNRLMEKSLYLLELISVLAVPKGVRYPQREIETVWKEVLLYQFHDILPGSSIRRVYEESTARYRALYHRVRALTETALDAFGKDRGAYYNPTSFARTETVREGDAWYRVSCAPFGKGEVTPAHPTPGLSATNSTLENALVRYSFGADGQIVSCLDKRTGLEALESGNKLSVYADDGDCWDIADNYALRPRGAFRLVTQELRADDVCAERTQELVYGDSRLTQTLTLYDDSPCLTVATHADWRENGKMLRAEFTTPVRADRVECDIQFGRISRPTGENTAAEFAQSEICAQKWIDYAQADFGVALVNDCKYGYRVKGSEMSIDLLRSPDDPGEGADRGEHDFTYMVYPHGVHSRVEALAYGLNFGLIKVPDAFPGDGFGFSGDESAVVESVKKCEEGDDVIVRLYENRGRYARAELNAAWQPYESDMTERKGEPIGRTLTLSPFEIKTVRLSGN